MNIYLTNLTNSVNLSSNNKKKIDTSTKSVFLISLHMKQKAKPSRTSSSIYLTLN